MYIKKLTIRDLYGKDYDLEFDSKLTILYGLNGSGKTTVLNIINNIINGYVEELSKYRFKYIRCIFNNNNGYKDMLIERDGIELRVKINNELVYDSINDLKARELRKYQYVEIDSKKIYKDIKNNSEWSITDAIYLSIDREISATGIGFKNPRSRIIYSKKRSMESTNIDQSLKLAQAYFKDHRYSVKETSIAIQNQIEKSMLKEISLPEYSTLTILSAKELNQLSKAYERSFKNNQIYLNIEKLIDQYLNLLEANDFCNPQLHYASLQLNKLNNVMKEITEKKNYLDKLEKTEKDLMKMVNLYFSDTNKFIKYSKSTYSYEDSLYFINAEDNNSEYLPLNLLSSGEKQLIILLIFSILNIESRKKSKIFMVDEPELSLHISWQKNLLKTIMNYSKDTQIIVATHSPDIINDYYKFVTEVRGYKFNES